MASLVLIIKWWAVLNLAALAVVLWLWEDEQ